MPTVRYALLYGMPTVRYALLYGMPTVRYTYCAVCPTVRYAYCQPAGSIEVGTAKSGWAVSRRPETCVATETLPLSLSVESVSEDARYTLFLAYDITPLAGNTDFPCDF